MKIGIRLLLLPLLLLCDRSAAGSSDHGSVGTKSEPRDRFTGDIRLMEEKPNQMSQSERSAATWTSNSSRNAYPCPVYADIAPCVCTSDDNLIVNLDCTLVKSEEQLERVFQQEFPIKKLGLFFMESNSDIKVLGNFLNGITFETIQLYPGPFALNQVNEYFILDNRDTLTYFEIYDSQLESDLFPFATLSEMNNLDYFNIHISLLTWVPPIIAPSLPYLGLAYGLTDVIRTGTFPIHEGDAVLQLEYNHITSVEPGSIFFFDQKSILSNGTLSIDLTQNELQSVQAGTFPMRNSTVMIHLFNNQLVSVEPGAFFIPEAAGVPNTGEYEILLQNNHIQSLQAGTFLLRSSDVTLSLQNNSIASIEPGTFVLPEATGDVSSGTHRIFLFDNNLESLQAGTFPIQNAEVMLYFYNNQINSIEPGTFFIPEEPGATNNTGQLVIDFHYNQLQSLQAGTFPLRNTEIFLYFYGNQIDSIEPGTFVLPEATDYMEMTLNLGNNTLTTVDEVIFGDLMPFMKELRLYGNPLSCECDIAWLVINSDLLLKVDVNATCADGTNLHDLDPQYFEDSC